MLSGIISSQTTSADTVWYQSVTSRCCPVTGVPGRPLMIKAPPYAIPWESIRQMPTSWPCLKCLSSDL